MKNINRHLALFFSLLPFFIGCLLFFLLSAPLLAEDYSTRVEGQVQRLAPITVTAERIPQYVKNHPQNVVVMNQEEIKKRNFLEVGEALASMPGVDVRQSSGSMGTKISIRGGGSGSVLILVDGRPLNSSQYGGVDLNTIPVEIVKQVMVFKPPVPVWLGQGSTAGAVNIVTVSPTRSTSKKSKNKGRFKIRGGSYGTANASCTYTVPQDQGSIMLTAGGGHKDGKRPNSDRDSGNFSFNWSKKSQVQTKYDLNVRYYQTEHGSPGPTDNETPNARQKYRKGSLDFHTDGLIGDTGEFSMKWYADIKDLKDRADDGRISTLENCKYGMKGETIWSHEERGALRLGGLLEKNEVEHDISGDHHREKASLHLQHDREIYDFTISFGLRGEHSSDFGYFPAGNIGLSYTVGQNTLFKTNAGYSVEIPTFNQLYQPSHGSIDQVRGNPDLSEEEIYSYDLSLEHSFSKKTIFNATLFRTDTRDMITYLRDENLIYHPDNISRAYKQGVEIFLTSKWQGNISLDLSYIYQDTENKETNKDLPYSPRHNAKLTGKFVLPTGTKIEAIFKALSRQYSSPGTVQSKKLDSYCVVNLKTIHPILIKSLPCEIFVHINNLFDTDFESHADYPDDGFRFIAGMNMNF